MDNVNKPSQSIENVVIIGSGPAGHTAAIYAGRAKLEPLMLEGEFAGGVAAGGQLTTTTEVENFPGFPEGITGPELMDAMRNQSIRCGTRIETLTAENIDLSVRPFLITTRKGTLHAHSIIIATGATAKRLGIDGEELYWQKGISACAVCDGALPVFRNKPLVVIGGGDSAVEEATYLTKFASQVTMIVRRDELRASKTMQDRAFDNKKITIQWNSVAEEALGDGLLTNLRIRNVQTNERSVIQANGLFYAIGHLPNTAFLQGQIDVDDTGYIVIPNPGSTATNVTGVFACGDVQDKLYRQAVTAAGSGCMAALDTERYLTENGLIEH